MARSVWLAVARAMVAGGLGVVGGVLGAAVGGATGVVIGIETVPDTGIPPHENFLGAFSVFIRAACSGAVGAVAGAIGGAVLASLVGAWAARKATARVASQMGSSPPPTSTGPLDSAPAEGA